MDISITLTEEEALLLHKYAKQQCLSEEEFIHKIVIEKIENEYDLEIYNKAIAEYNANPVTYSLEEIKKDLELWVL